MKPGRIKELREWAGKYKKSGAHHMILDLLTVIENLQAVEMIEVPQLAGFRDAAAILKWSPQRLRDYIKRGAEPKFPEPVQILSSGPVFVEQQVIDFAEAWKIEKGMVK